MNLNALEGVELIAKPCGRRNEVAIKIGSRRLSWKPQLSAIVVFDSTPELEEILSGRAFTAFDPRYQKLVLRPLLVALVEVLLKRSTKSLSHHYFLSFLRIAKPEIVITTIDNNRFFYSVRPHISSEVKFVAIQNGIRWSQTVPSETNYLHAHDLILSISECQASLFRAQTKARVVAAGTAGSCIAKETLPASRDLVNVAFISSWKVGKVIGGTLTKHDHLGNAYPHPTYYESEIESLKMLQTVLKNLSFCLNIIGRAPSPKLQQQEIAFYSRILGASDWRYVARQDGAKSYSALANYKLIFSMTSTLGYEAIGLGKKVVFIEPKIEHRDFRQPAWYPVKHSLSKMTLSIDSADLLSWNETISTILLMDWAEYREQIEPLLGRGPIDFGLKRVRELVFFGLNGSNEFSSREESS